ncbi:MAG: hypothetical protein HYX84_08070 [Chloroflexi bacterium]|nr:hypothetical protein [Chloroflexota bacterium]
MEIRRRQTGFWEMLATVVFLWLTAFLTLSCGQYRGLVLREINASFALEYPSSYARPVIDRTAGPQFTAVVIYRLVKDGKLSVDPLVSISINSALDDSAKTLMEDDLRHFEAGFLYSEFKLTERAQISVSDIQGEQIIYSWTRLPDLLNS